VGHADALAKHYGIPEKVEALADVND